MNYKLEKFWNYNAFNELNGRLRWTINLKSFEINRIMTTDDTYYQWTINLKSFEIYFFNNSLNTIQVWTINLKSFEIIPSLFI